MARSVNIWVIEQYGALTGDYTTIATFTVKHEMQYVLERLPISDLRRCRVKRFKDGVTFQQSYAGFKPHYVDVPLSSLTERVK